MPARGVATAESSSACVLTVTTPLPRWFRCLDHADAAEDAVRLMVTEATGRTVEAAELADTCTSAVGLVWTWRVFVT